MSEDETNRVTRKGRKNLAFIHFVFLFQKMEWYDAIRVRRSK